MQESKYEAEGEGEIQESRKCHDEESTKPPTVYHVSIKAERELKSSVLHYPRYSTLANGYLYYPRDSTLATSIIKETVHCLP